MDSDKPVTNPAMLIVLAVVRSLHRTGVLPIQAVAEEMDRRALNAKIHGTETEDEVVVRDTAVALQRFADMIEKEQPFASRFDSSSSN